MAIYIGDKMVKKLHIGDKPIRGIFVGEEKVWPNIVRVEKGEDYGAWSYSDPNRSRTVTPWEYDVFVDGTVSEKRYGTAYTQTQTASVSYNYGAWTYNNPTRTRYVTPVYTYSDITRTGTAYPESQTASTTTQQDGYWNGACGTNYYYVDYPKLRAVYTYSDTVQYGGWYNGAARSQRIDGSCGWTRAWRVTADWANTGETCDANGTLNGYSCDGTYTVRYYRQRQIQSYCYPDGSGSTSTQTYYRAGAQYSKTQVNGQCGYSATVTVKISLADNTTDGGFGNCTATVKSSSGATRTVNLPANSTTDVVLNSGDTLTQVVIGFMNSATKSVTYNFIGTNFGTKYLTLAAGGSGSVTFDVNRAYSSGATTINFYVTQS